MTIQQAIRQKKRLVNKIENELEKIFICNTLEDFATCNYSSRECLDNYMQLSEQYIALKTVILKSSIDMIETKCRIKMLKLLIKQLKNLSCAEGLWKDEFNRANQQIFKSEITDVERDKLVEKYQDEIGKLEDELDAFNSGNILNL
jgi:hypothetical protein